VLSTLSHILYSSQESNIPQLTHSVVCRQDKWGSACSNLTISLTTRFVTVSNITFFPSGKSLSSAALALSRPLTTLRMPHSLSLKKPYHHTLCRYSAIFVSTPVVVVTQFHPLFMAMCYSESSPTLAEAAHNYCRSQETVLRARFSAIHLMQHQRLHCDERSYFCVMMICGN